MKIPRVHFFTQGIFYCMTEIMKQEEGISTFLSSVRALIGDEAYAKKLQKLE